ncbi:hypothetical protein HK102_001523 [Quaeritorhiza haematococci]|nr:hypothetical protein HK102_001523 [Quaeritorhiza haematococci]
MPHRPYHRSESDPAHSTLSAGPPLKSRHPSSKLYTVAGVDSTSSLSSQFNTLAEQAKSQSKGSIANDGRNKNKNESPSVAGTSHPNHNPGEIGSTPNLTPDEAQFIQSMVSLSTDSKGSLNDVDILCQSFPVAGAPRMVSIREHSFLKKRKKDLELLTIMRSISDTLRSAVDISRAGSAASTATNSRRASRASSATRRQGERGGSSNAEGTDYIAEENKHSRESSSASSSSPDSDTDGDEEGNESEEELLEEDMLPVVKELLGKCKRFVTHDPVVETELSSLKETLHSTYEILLKRRFCTLTKQVSDLRETASKMRAQKAEKERQTKKMRRKGVREAGTKAGHTRAIAAAKPIRKKAELDDISVRVPKMTEESLYSKHPQQPSLLAADEITIAVSSSASGSWDNISQNDSHLAHALGIPEASHHMHSRRTRRATATPGMDLLRVSGNGLNPAKGGTANGGRVVTAVEGTLELLDHKFAAVRRSSSAIAYLESSERMLVSEV